MKRIIVLSAAATMLYAISQVCGCGDRCGANPTGITNGANAQTVESNRPAGQAGEIIKGEPKTVTLKITGMTCSGCANHVSKALGKVDGVLEEEVKYPGNIAIIKYDTDKTSEKDIIAAIEKTGYKAVVMKDDGKASLEEGKKSCAPNYIKSCCATK